MDSNKREQMIILKNKTFAKKKVGKLSESDRYYISEQDKINRGKKDDNASAGNTLRGLAGLAGAGGGYVIGRAVKKKLAVPGAIIGGIGSVAAVHKPVKKLVKKWDNEEDARHRKVINRYQSLNRTDRDFIVDQYDKEKQARIEEERRRKEEELEERRRREDREDADRRNRELIEAINRRTNSKSSYYDD